MTGSLRLAWMLLLVLVGVPGMLFGSAPIALAAPKGPARIVLPAGVPVQVQIKADLSSQTAKAGDVVTFVVSAPVQVAGVQLIASGAEARGSVAYVAPATSSRHGDLLVSLDSAQAVDGSWVPLRATAKPVDSADTILPASVVTFGGGRLPVARDALLLASRRLECWVDEARAFVVTPPERPGALATAVSEGEATPRTEARCTLVRLPLGTAVRVHPVKEISARRVNAGDRVDFAIATAVEAGGTVVLREGARAWGVVLWARPLGVAGTRSELVVTVDRVEAQDGSKIAVVASSSGRGADAEPSFPAGPVPLAAVVTSEGEAVLAADRAFDLVLCEERLFALGARGPKKGEPQVRSLVMPSETIPVAPPTAAGRPPVLEAFQVGLDVGPSGEPRGVADAFSRVSRLVGWCSLEPVPQERQFEVAWFRDGVHYATSGAMVVKSGESRTWTALESASTESLAPGRWVAVLSWRGRVLDVQSFTVRP